WDPARRILWADESRAGAAQTLAGAAPGPWAILIGPEGGFSESERGTLRALPFVLPMSLGPRILRAETAALAVITLWQAQFGDWT
ncbi:MAG: RsmE family RNA methyltransferase, partial [Albidovulum sp.]